LSEEEQIKRKEFTYLSFLWKEYAEIRVAERDGNYPRALSLAISLVPYLPRAMKKKLGKEAKQIKEDMRQIIAKTKGSSFHNTQILKNRTLNGYASSKLPIFIDELSTLLDKRQYMEQISKYPVGVE